MTPRRLDRGMVQRKLTLVDELLRDLEHIGAVDAELLRRDRVTRHAVAAAAAGVISEELAGRLKPSVGMRNLLVHDYASIDLAQVADAVRRALEDYQAYVEAVARFLAGDAIS